MNAVDPPRKLKALTAESRILRRGVLGDRVDGRSREGRFLLRIERGLVDQVGRRRQGDAPARLQRPVRSGRVVLPRNAPWLDEYILELIGFPGTKHDDQVDSTTQALDYLREPDLVATYVKAFLG